MNTYIVLLRGINVGGRNLLPMKDLKLLLHNAGFENVTSYIQSGNLILNSQKNPSEKIQSLIKKKYGFQPDILSLSKQQFSDALKNNPFQTHEVKLVHFYFCTTPPKIQQQKIEQLRSESEHYKLINNIFYLYAPDGIGRSKLVSNIENCLGVSATGRNTNTINKLNEIILKDFT